MKFLITYMSANSSQTPFTRNPNLYELNYINSRVDVDVDSVTEPHILLSPNQRSSLLAFQLLGILPLLSFPPTLWRLCILILQRRETESKVTYNGRLFDGNLNRVTWQDASLMTISPRTRHLRLHRFYQERTM